MCTKKSILGMRLPLKTKTCRCASPFQRSYSIFKNFTYILLHTAALPFTMKLFSGKFVTREKNLK